MVNLTTGIVHLTHFNLHKTIHMQTFLLSQIPFHKINISQYANQCILSQCWCQRHISFIYIENYTCTLTYNKKFREFFPQTREIKQSRGNKPFFQFLISFQISFIVCQLGGDGRNHHYEIHIHNIKQKPAPDIISREQKKSC